MRDLEAMYSCAKLLALTLVLALAACGGTDAVEPMPRDAFVDVMVALRQAAATTASQAEFEARRAEILAAAHVTDSTLVAYVRMHARQLGYMAEVWDSVHARLRVTDDTIER